jgi:hypothetical protein
VTGKEAKELSGRSETWLRMLIIATGLAVGFALTWWVADMVSATRATVHTPAAQTTNELPRLLRPGLGFASGA